MGRERGYPLGARGSPCDADYEDGSVPLQLPPSCADHLHRSAKRRLSPPGDPMSVQQRGHLSASVRTSSRPAELSFGPRLRRQALRLRRTAHAAVGLDRSARPNERHPCLDGNIYADCRLGRRMRDGSAVAAVANAHLTECRNERRLDTMPSGWHGFSRHAALNVWWSTRPACRSIGALAEQRRIGSMLACCCGR